MSVRACTRARSGWTGKVRREWWIDGDEADCCSWVWVAAAAALRTCDRCMRLLVDCSCRTVACSPTHQSHSGHCHC